VHHCVFSFACKAPGVGGAFGVCAIAPKLRGGVDFPGYIRDRPASQQMGMTLAVRGIPQHTFREVRFADLVFVAGRQCIPCFVEDGPQDSSVAGSYAQRLLMGVYSNTSRPAQHEQMRSRLPVEHMTIAVTSWFQAVRSE